jgi:ATP-dependent DNA ligase
MTLRLSRLVILDCKHAIANLLPMSGIRPSSIPPMLATRVAKLPDGAEWEYEVKWDGYRIEAVKDEATVHPVFKARRGLFHEI